MENTGIQTLSISHTNPGDLYDLGMLEDMDDEVYTLEVLEVFLTETARELAEMKMAMLSGNIDAVCKKAHSIKGGAGIIQATTLIRLMEAIEASGKNGSAANQLAGLADKATFQYNCIERELKKKMPGLRI